MNRPKLVQIQDMTDVITSDYEDEVFFDPHITQKETKSQIEIEDQIHRQQVAHNRLNLMYLIDISLYCCFAFPYTFMRLVLDLFMKDRLKINLDFFILYKITLITFHMHLIAKFILLSVFSTTFRVNLAKLFALDLSEEDCQPDSNCCFNNSTADDSDRGEFFNVQLHTKLDSNFDHHSLELKITIIPAHDIDLNDKNFAKTNV